MMRRSRRLQLFGLAAGPVVPLVAAGLVWPRTAITRANAAKIQLGMTLAEVEAILGGPPRDETGGRGWALDLIPIRFVSVDDVTTAEWIGADCAVRIEFHEGRVDRKWVADVVEDEERPLDRLRRWFGL
jgi:hypothetical protein